MNNVSDEGGGKVRQSRPLCRVRVCASLLTADCGHRGIILCEPHNKLSSFVQRSDCVPKLY